MFFPIYTAKTAQSVNTRVFFLRQPENCEVQLSEFHKVYWIAIYESHRCLFFLDWPHLMFPCSKTDRLAKGSECYQKSLSLNPFLWSPFESLCQIGEFLGIFLSPWSLKSLLHSIDIWVVFVENEMVCILCEYVHGKLLEKPFLTSFIGFLTGFKTISETSLKD